MLKLVKFFISSKTALQELKNPYFIDILKAANIDMPDQETFKEKILNDIVFKVKKAINNKLGKSSNVILIADIWSNSQMNDFLGVAVILTNENLEKECYLMGVDKMPDHYTAKNIKILVEKIVNDYEWNKSNILGIT